MAVDAPGSLDDLPGTWGEALQHARRTGIERLDADLLLGHLCEVSRSALISRPETPLPEGLARGYAALLRRRRDGEPLAHLTGSTDFHGIKLLLSRDVLIPRDDTELLVDLCLDLNLPEDARILDAGTGSGAIVLALLAARPAWRAIATDLQDAAIEVARRNAQRLGLAARLQLRSGHWYEPVAAQRFDLIVSNPPYVADGSPELAADVARFEPATALFAGSDGLDDIRVLVAGARAHLHDGGWLALEHGFDQGPGVAQLLAAAGFEAIDQHRDLGGHLRATIARTPAAERTS